MGKHLESGVTGVMERVGRIRLLHAVTMQIADTRFAAFSTVKALRLPN